MSHPIHFNYPGLTAEEAEGPLRVVRGVVDTSGSGSITSGKGFTITRNGTGDVTVNFTRAFAVAPTVVSEIGSATLGKQSQVSTVAAGSARVLVADASNSAADGTFAFIAIGPA